MKFLKIFQSLFPGFVVAGIEVIYWQPPIAANHRPFLSVCQFIQLILCQLFILEYHIAFKNGPLAFSLADGISETDTSIFLIVLYFSYEYLVFPGLILIYGIHQHYSSPLITATLSAMSWQITA